MKNFLIIFLNVFCLHACMYIVYMPGALISQKRALDPLELELGIVVSQPPCGS